MFERDRSLEPSAQPLMAKLEKFGCTGFLLKGQGSGMRARKNPKFHYTFRMPQQSTKAWEHALVAAEQVAAPSLLLNMLNASRRGKSTARLTRAVLHAGLGRSCFGLGFRETDRFEISAA